MDANCNTCKNLCRLESKVKHGFLKGKCDKFNDTHPYYKDTFFYFHPEDFMGMNCWESRK